MSRRQNIRCCIVIPVVVGLALWAIPLSHGQGQRFQNVSANGTPLAGRKEAVHLLQRLAVPIAFVFSQLSEQSKRGVRESAGKGVILDHAAHVQILDADRIESPDEIGSDLVHVVETGVRDLGVNLRHPKLGAFPSTASLDAARENPLRSDELLRLLDEMPWVRDAFAIGKRREPVDPEIYADSLAGLRKLGPFLVEYQGGVVSTSPVLADGNRGGLALKRPGPSYTQSSDTRKNEVAVGSVPPKSTAGIFGRLCSDLLFEGRVASTLLEEVTEGGLKMPERLLSRDAGNLVQPRMIFLLLKFGEGGGTGVVVDGLAIVVAVGSEPESPVIDVPAGTENAGKCLLLGTGGIESESVSELHNNHYTHVNAVVKSRIPPSPERDGLLRRTL